MKKKVVIPIVVCLILVIGITGFILFNNRVVSTITLDINPSIKINITKNEKVKSVVALNEDAKEIISNNLKGKSLDDTIKVIKDNVIDKGYAEDKEIVILVYSTGDIKSGIVEEKVRNNFSEEEYFVNVIAIETVTEEDIKFAKEHNITPAKAAFISTVLESNENIDAEILVNKPIKDLNETKMRGTYCDDGYILEGDFCLKEIERILAVSGDVCPNGYYEYNGKCYEEIPSLEKEELICRDEFELREEECIRKIVFDAEPSKFSCSKGEAKTRLELDMTGEDAGDANYIVCVDYSNATHPVTPCELPANDPTERMSFGGKCYWHRAPVIAEGCPGKIQVNGMCWDDATNIYICAGYRDGKQYSSKDEFCEHSIKYIDPTITEYKCPEGHTVNGSKCEKEEIEPAMHERYCKEGYTLVNNDRCINYNNEVDKVDGLICNQENSKLRGTTCVIYDIVDAKHN